jgi:hypothetical protein
MYNEWRKFEASSTIPEVQKIEKCECIKRMCLSVLRDGLKKRGSVIRVEEAYRHGPKNTIGSTEWPQKHVPF